MTDEEINTRIAREVMGWEPHIRNTGFWVKAQDKTGLMDGFSITRLRFLDDDWSGVRLVVERMEALGFAPTMRKTGIKDCPGLRWGASFRHDDYPKVQHAHADTLPRAVCLAALKAMEAKP